MSVQNKQTGSGYKFHATNSMNTTSWRYECAEWDSLKSVTCVTLTRIGKLPGWGAKPSTECIAMLDSVLRRVPLEVAVLDRHDFPTFTCRAWFREAIRYLHQSRYIVCPEVLTLETRLTNLAIAIHSKGEKRPLVMPPLVWPDYAPSVSSPMVYQHGLPFTSCI